MQFQDRVDAGGQLGQKLQKFAHRSDVLVLAIPRGGVPVAFEIAQALHAPLDVMIVRKLGVPGQKELAMGAIAPGGIRLLNNALIHALGISSEAVERVTAAEQEELQRRQVRYRGNRPFPNLKDRTVILVDDGLATGATMAVAVKAIRQLQPESLVLAVPVAARESCALFRGEVDEMITAITPAPFYGVGYWYKDFSQTTDAEVQELLTKANQP